MNLKKVTNKQSGKRHWLFLYLNHSRNDGGNLCAPVTSIAALVVVVELLLVSAVGGRELDGPKEVGSLLKVGAAGVDFVNQVLNANDVVLSENPFNNTVVSDRDALLVYLSKAALVNQLLDKLKRGLTVHDIGLDKAKHVDSSFVELDKNGIVDLAQAQQLQNLANFGAVANNTTDANHQGYLGFSLDVDVASSTSLATQANGVILLGLVFLDICLGAFESLGAVFLALGCVGLLFCFTLGLKLREGCALFQHGFGDAV